MNLSSLLAGSHSFTTKDDPMTRPEEDILDSASEMYDSERLWTYGFIRALLEHCSSKSNRTERKRMTLFTRLSPCQPMALVNEEKEIAWIRMKE